MYEGTCGEGGQVHALKLVSIDSALPGAEQKRERFVREVEQHLALSHDGARHVVPIRDHNLAEFAQGATWGFLVMPRAFGTLERDIGVFRGRSELTLEIYRQLVLGVEAAHRRGIVHRDIKPSNVLFMEKDLRDPCLSDFGICFIKDQARLTQTGETVGAMFFMAPEQEQGGRVDVDQRADIYALGKLLHYMLTGRHLRREDLAAAFTPEERSRDHRLQPIHDEILSKTITAAPDERFAAVTQLLDRIDSLLERAGPPEPATVRSVPSTPSEGHVSHAAFLADFREAGTALSRGNLYEIRVRLDGLLVNFRQTWGDTQTRIAADYGQAPAAAKGLIQESTPVAAIVLAAAQTGAVSLGMSHRLLN